MYSFKDYAFGSPALATTSDPVTVDLATDGHGHNTQLHIEPMTYGETSLKSSYVLGPGRSYLSRDIEFHRIFVTQSDLSIHELVVYSCENDTSMSLDGGVEDFKRVLIRQPRRNISRREVLDDAVDFVVPDGLDALADPGSSMWLQTPRWSRAQAPRSFPRVIDYQLLYHALIRSERHFDEPDGLMDIAVLSTELQQLLSDDSSLLPVPLGTL